MNTMEATREIYWNVGHGVVPLMYLLAAIATGLLAWGFARRIRVYRLGRAQNRTDQLGARILDAVRAAFSQRLVLRSPGAGVPHAFFFWSFAVLFVGTLLVMLQADFTEPLLGRIFLRGGFYLVFSLALDVAGIVAIVGLVALLVRRLVLRARGLESRPEDWGAHALLLAILVTGFLVEGARIAATELVTNPGLARYSPGGAVVATLMSGLGAPALASLHLTLWWVHLLLVIGFLIALPWIKLRHLATTALGRLFADRRPRGTLDKLDLEAEDATFGASKVADLGWKDIFDADACTLCQRCQDACPATTTGKPLSPMRVVRQIGETARTNPDANLIEVVGSDAIWACTNCFACQDTCPASVEHISKIIEMRRHLTLVEAAVPDEAARVFKNIETQGNPWGIGSNKRAEWAEGLDVPRASDGGEFEYLFFVGCAGAYDERQKKVTRAIVRILKEAKVSFAILGEEETCTGDAARRLGNEYLFQMQAQANVETLNGYGVKKILTQCPHCLNSIRNDLPDFGGNYEVVHHTELIAQLAKEGRLAPRAAAAFADKAVTFHDPCNLSRYNGQTAAPREALALAGVGVTEMGRTGRNGFCCGAGGGRMWLEEKIGTRINRNRVDEASATLGEAGGVIAVGCPFCLTMMKDGVAEAGREESIQILDVAEIVAGQPQGARTP